MKIPRVGIGVIVIKGNKVLLGKRMNAHGNGCWSFGGGHLEFGETVEDCAKREIYEETGLIIKDIEIGPITQDFFTSDDKHYITIFTLARIKRGQPKNMEPDRCEEWKWYDWNNLPEPLFEPIINLIKTGFNPIKNHG